MEQRTDKKIQQEKTAIRPEQKVFGKPMVTNQLEINAVLEEMRKIVEKKVQTWREVMEKFGPKAIPILADIIKTNPNEVTVRSCCSSLNHFAYAGFEAEVTAILVEALGRPDQNDRISIAMFLGPKYHYKDPNMRKMALDALVRAAKEDKERSVRIDCLSHISWFEQEHNWEGIDIGTEARTQIVQTLLDSMRQDPDQEVRKYAIECLGDLPRKTLSLGE